MTTIPHKHVITHSVPETKQVASEFLREVLFHSERRTLAVVICLDGELGAGKTVFAQGLLETLGAPAPYGSPTFQIIKTYDLPREFAVIKTVYHIDTYRIKADDLLALGWEEMISESSNLLIVEWPSRVEKILPEDAYWVHFREIDEFTREIVYKDIVCAK